MANQIGSKPMDIQIEPTRVITAKPTIEIGGQTMTGNPGQSMNVPVQYFLEGHDKPIPATITGGASYNKNTYQASQSTQHVIQNPYQPTQQPIQSYQQPTQQSYQQPYQQYQQPPQQYQPSTQKSIVTPVKANTPNGVMTGTKVLINKNSPMNIGMNICKCTCEPG